MSQKHERRSSDSPYIETVWQSIALTDGEYLATPDGSWDLIAVQKANGERIVFLAGQVTRPLRLSYYAGEQSVVISFSPGVYISFLKGAPLTNDYLMLPLTDDGRQFKLAGMLFDFPTYENAERLIDQMSKRDVLQQDAVVDGILKGAPKASSHRSVQRHFKEVTGITKKKLDDIYRAKKAVRLLKDGKRPLDVAVDAGYYDQPHLSKSLKNLMDSTPNNVDDVNQV